MKYNLTQHPPKIILQFFQIGFVFFSILITNAYASQQPERKSNQLLDLNQPVIVDISTGQSDSYPIKLEAGYYVHLLINPQGIKLEVKLYDPSGHLRGEIRCRQIGQTPVSFIAKNAGLYKLVVTSAEDHFVSGSYNVMVEEVRLARRRDNLQILAEKSMAEGEQLRWRWRKDFSRLAITKFEKSISYWKVLNNRQEESAALNMIGEIYQVLGQTELALTYYDRSLRIGRQTKDVKNQINALNGLGYLNNLLGHKEKALQYLNEARAINKNAGYPHGEIYSLLYLGVVFYSKVDYKKTIELSLQALSISQRVKDRRNEALALYYLGDGYAALRLKNQAFFSYEKSLALWRALGDIRGETLTLINIATLNSEIGNKQEALNLYDKALKSIHAIGDLDWEASTYNGLAYVYEEIGDKLRSIEYHKKALLLFQKIGMTQIVASTMIHIGSLYEEVGQYQQSLSFINESQNLIKTFQLKSLEPLFFLYLGRTLEALGQHQKAFESYNQALAINQEIKRYYIEAQTLNTIGNLYFKNGDKQKALASYRSALQINKLAEDRYGEVATLYYLSRVERDLSLLTEARKHIEEAITLAESLRDNVKGPEFRTSYFATVQKSFDLYIDLLMQQHKRNPASGFEVQALESSERARARTFLEALLESRVDIRKGVDPELLQREKEVKQKIDEKANYREQLLAKLHTEAQLNAVTAEINELTAEQEQIRARIRDASPNYSSITFTQPIQLKGIQELLDPGTLLLEYRLGEERSYLWLVSHNDVKSYELPARKVIESEAGQVVTGFTAPDSASLVATSTPSSQSNKSELDFQKLVERLSDLLLGQIAPSMKSKRLLIVADGVLQYIPFAALTSPNSSSTRIPLIVDHEIINLPSASVLAALRKEFGVRALAPKSIAVIADPVFTKEDVHFNNKNRSLAAVASNHSFNRDVVRAFSETGVKNKRRAILRLPFAREEADNILNLVTDGSALKAIEFDASLAKVKSLDLQQYRIIHFATHGLANSENPYLSGIVLSLFDETGKPQDGFLRLQDISDLKLASELVVLSACRTALGKEFRGEGLISLTRGFMQAGSKRVLASLWNVNDAVTADFMKHFYQGVLVKGLSPAAALRAAQIAMWKQKNKNAPYYWAAFVLEGEWK